MNIREKTEKKVFSYMEEHHMVAPNDKIVLGVSGGADSVCLFLLLLAYGEKVPLSLAVVHVNHGIREDADRDARYVEELCRQKGVSFFLTNANVHKFARKEKCSEEDAGRRIRYEAFRKAAEKWGGVKAAVAHNSNDNAETMLFHLFRGSSVKGLGGIAPVRKEEFGQMNIIRPILCLERREVEAYLRERQVPWCTDSTNGGDDYCRNRIRHHIVPYAEQHIVPGAVRHMCQTADMLRETEAFLELQTEGALRECLISEENAGGIGRGAAPVYVLDVKKFESFHVLIQKRMLFALACRLSPSGKDISAVHIRDVLTLFEGEKHREVTLPFGIVGSRQYGNVSLERRKSPDDSKFATEIPLTEEMFHFPAVYGVGDLGEMEISAFYRKKEEEVSKNRYTKWFDYDKIEKYVTIRTRQQGDFFTIADGAGNRVHKSLKNYMITEKIPRQLRESIPVVAVGNHILWLVGWRISEYFKVDGDTKRILQVKFVARESGRDCEGSETEEENVRTH